MNLNELINQEKRLIVDNYIDMQVEAENIYGKNTVILVEIGSFYEIYQVAEIGKASIISKELNIVLTRKNKSIREISSNNPSLCGIPVISIDKHMTKLTELNKWTILIVNQKGIAPNITREISKIISPGTNVDYLKNDNYNYIASVFIEETTENIIYAGLSMIDISTGKVISYENYGSKNDKQIAIDEIHNIIKTNNCSEIIFTFENVNNEDSIVDTLTNYGKIASSKKEFKKVKKILKISYQNELLKKVFRLESFLSPIEDLDMERTPHALNSLIVLIEFISDHNLLVIEKLKRPINVDNNNYLYLGNNALEQLNITGDKNKSLISIINNGCSAIGKRFISEQLMNPMINKKEIENRYKYSEYFENEEDRNIIRQYLKEIYDIERLWRKIELNSINPFELYNLYSSIEHVLEVYKLLLDKGDLITHLRLSERDIDQLNDFKEILERNFDLNLLSIFSLQNINANFFNIEIIPELDSINIDIKEKYMYINKIGKEISLFFQEEIENIDLYKNPREFKSKNIKIGFNDSEGFYYEITVKKYNSIKDIENKLSKYGEFSTKNLKNSIKIYFKDLENIMNMIVSLETRLISLNKEYFINFISKIELTNIDNVIHFISYTEFLINNAILHDKFMYNKPEIIETEDNNNFIEAINLRHAIIEQIQENETYIPNDIVLGNKKYVKNEDLLSEIFQEKEYVNGLLLYGLNSSGKSSTMKSLGISIILAQAGFYVPATTLRFTLFESLFTRITSSDNIHKGLSTFAIEMLELKNIFNRSNGKTLVLGDEIAHGTETISALSIVSSAVSVLAERNVFFIFATHLHKLKEIPEIQEIKSIVNVHLEVSYNEDLDLLVYNRKLKSGQGSSIYGLEFAKYMKMDKEFLAKAYAIRNSIANDISEINSITRQKKSKYNKDKIVSSCKICGNEGKEEHHILEQQTADKNGHIDHVHKNHKSNLIDLCISCHDKIHKGKIEILGYRSTSEGNKLIFNIK